MKRSILFLAALGALVMTGCNMNGGSSSFTQPFLMETTETTGNNVVVTTYERDAEGYVTRERQTRNGATVYEISDFEYEIIDNNFYTNTRTRVLYDYQGDGASKTQTIVSTHDYYDREFLYEVFDEGDTDPIESRKTDYESDRVKEYIVRENGLVTLHRTDYRYEESSRPVQMFTESVNAGPPVRKAIKITLRDQNSILGYETWSNLPLDGSTWNGTDGNKIEEMVEFESTASGTEWKIKKYDDEGNLLSTTDVENEIEMITIHY